jgi:hypothetical protein
VTTGDFERQPAAHKITKALVRLRSFLLGMKSPASDGKGPRPLIKLARAMTVVHANSLDAERSTESAPDPLIIIARQMMMARMWYS